LGRLIRSNQLMALARARGYQVIAIGSDYSATQSIDVADVCRCEETGLDEIEQAMLAKTPLMALPFSTTWAFDAHRRKVLQAFAAIEDGAPSPRRKFVFAHILAPHPPFLFHPDGSARVPALPAFAFADGNDYREAAPDYVEGYREQVQFVVRRLRQTIETILRSPGPTPVIVMHGDHGPGSMLVWDDPGATNMHERMEIFAAYRFPDAKVALYPTMSPVNGARALASEYLDTPLPFLPEKTAFSTWTRPYDFIPVNLDSDAPR
jgi:hypothetical protein